VGGTAGPTYPPARARGCCSDCGRAGSRSCALLVAIPRPRGRALWAGGRSPDRAKRGGVPRSRLLPLALLQPQSPWRDTLVLQPQPHLPRGKAVASRWDEPPWPMCPARGSERRNVGSAGAVPGWGCTGGLCPPARGLRTVRAGEHPHSSAHAIVAGPAPGAMPLPRRETLQIASFQVLQQCEPAAPVPVVRPPARGAGASLPAGQSGRAAGERRAGGTVTSRRALESAALQTTRTSEGF